MRPVLAVLALAVLATTAAAQPIHSATFQLGYAKGAEWRGALEGTCNVAGIRLTPAYQSALDLFLEKSTLIIHRSHGNDTFVGPGPLEGHVAHSDDGATEESITLPPGPTHVHFREGAKGFISNQDESGLTAPLVGRHILVERPEDLPSAGVAYPFGVASPPPYSSVVHFMLVLPGPSEEVQVDPGEHGVLTAAGRFALYLDSATLALADGSNIDLGEFRKSTTSADALAARRASIDYTWAKLLVDQGSFTMDREAGELFCRSFHLAADGSAVLRDVSGSLHGNGVQADFARRAFALAGRFQVDEDAGSVVQGALRTSQVNGTGDLDALSIDFASIPVQRASHVIPLTLGAILLALVLAVASQFSRIVGFFFTRATPATALRHPMRATLFGMAEQRPGLILKDVVASTGRPYGVVRHHARILEAVGLIKTLRIGSALHVYPHGKSLVEGKRNLLMTTDEPARFVVEEWRKGCHDVTKLRREVGANYLLTRMGAWKVVKRVQDAGLLTPPSAPGSPSDRRP